MFKKAVIILLFILITLPVRAEECECTFSDFFSENYAKLLEYLEPADERKYIFDILFNAYSIKFKALDYERKCRIEELCANECDPCRKEKENEIKNLATIAMEEYDSFLDDLNFELCDDENSEFKFIKKHKKKYKKELRKLISRNCK